LIKKDKITFVISPLKALEDDHIQQFHGMGLAAVAVNADTYDAALHKELLCYKYQIMYVSPKMLIKNKKFNSSLVCSPEYSKWVLDWVIDEAHYIS
ncbi:hypothetical protein F5I97DRAFT_1782428, partial [Phlebopus sp. FC_14]